MTTHLKVLLATVAFALAACSGDAAGTADSPATTETPRSSGAPSSSEAPDTGSTASAEQVAIDDFAYGPETLTVPAGTTVTWTNEDATSHTVTAGDEGAPDPATFDLPVDEQGQVVEFTFDEAGTYAYYCVLHPFMTAVVEVTG